MDGRVLSQILFLCRGVLRSISHTISANLPSLRALGLDSATVTAPVKTTALYGRRQNSFDSRALIPFRPLLVDSSTGRSLDLDPIKRAARPVGTVCALCDDTLEALLGCEPKQGHAVAFEVADGKNPLG